MLFKPIGLKMKRTILFILLMMVVACGKTEERKSSEVRQNISSIYGSNEIHVEVYYEEGAEPFTNSLLGIELWNLLKTNLEALFQGKSVVVKVPSTLAEMTKLTSQNKSSWTANNILDLSKVYPSTEASGITKFQIFFVKGFAEGNSQVIGFHISNTKVMAIFKDVIRNSSSGQLQLVPRYVEQATLIHEMGHALGLVNNGLPLTSSHQDAAHGAHCSNPECVMYYTNEGASDMLNFAKNASLKGTTVMFDKECLDDAQKYQN